MSEYKQHRPGWNFFSSVVDYLIISFMHVSLQNMSTRLVVTISKSPSSVPSSARWGGTAFSSASSMSERDTLTYNKPHTPLHTHTHTSLFQVKSLCVSSPVTAASVSSLTIKLFIQIKKEVTADRLSEVVYCFM